MSEYISREAVHGALAEYVRSGFAESASDLQGYTDKINAIPSADVRENIHGHWEDGNNICPKCGEDKFKGLEADIYADWQPNFCPWCGCCMKEEK